MARSGQQKRQTNTGQSRASLLNVENNQSSSPPNIANVNDRLVKVRVTTLDSGSARHVMAEGISPSVKLERKTTPMKFVAANGEQIVEGRCSPNAAQIIKTTATVFFF